jgi:hypothetical protein
MGALSKKKQSNTLFDMILVLVGSICSPSSGSVPRPSNIQARSLAQICANYFGSLQAPQSAGLKAIFWKTKLD